MKKINQGGSSVGLVRKLTSIKTDTIVESWSRLVECSFTCSIFEDWFKKSFLARFVFVGIRMEQDWFMAKTIFEFVWKIFF